MLKRNLVLRLASALAAASAVGLVPAFAYAAGPSAAITRPSAGMASVVLINRDTASGETLTVNFGGTTYTIPPQGGSSPNQVEFNLAPGSYDFTASVPGISAISHSINVAAGRVTSLSFQDNTADLQNGDQDADDVAQTQQVMTVVGNESDEHETKASDRDTAKDKVSGSDESSEKDSGPDGDEVHLQLGPSTVNDNDDLLVTVGDMTAQAQ
jgi:hypothetical protein